MLGDNKIRYLPRNVGNRDGDSNRSYGYCEYMENDYHTTPTNIFISSPKTNTILETYRGYEIRLYTGGKYLKFIKIETIISDWRSDEIRENEDIIITCKKEHSVRELMFAKIQPPLKEQVSQHWWGNLLFRPKKRVYVSDWMANPETVQDVTLAIAHLKAKIDEVSSGSIVVIDEHTEQVDHLIKSIKNPNPQPVEEDQNSRKPKES